MRARLRDANLTLLSSNSNVIQLHEYVCHLRTTDATSHLAILVSPRDTRPAYNVDYSNNNTLCVIEAENCDNGSGHQWTAGASNDGTRHSLASFLDMSTSDPPLLAGCVTVTKSPTCVYQSCFRPGCNNAPSTNFSKFTYFFEYLVQTNLPQPLMSVSVQNQIL